MKAAVIGFTAAGCRLAKRIRAGLIERQVECEGYAPEKYLTGGLQARQGSLSAWTETIFSQVDGIIFVGAAGIAVRAIAPFVRDKRTDPAVVVVDEKGQFAISLLSGHIGGANDLTLAVAQVVGARPVITTATDVNGLFAVDVFATDNGLEISSMELAKEVSAALLDGQPLGVALEEGVKESGPRPRLIGENGADIGLYIGVKTENSREAKMAGKIGESGEGPFARTLRLIPKSVVLGIGCRRGTGAEAIEAAVDRALLESAVDRRAVRAVATIDLKAEEPGLLSFCRDNGWELLIYTAEELNRLEGDFSTSEFVRQVTSVDCVCERAAVAGSGGRLLVRKQAGGGVTVAAARSDTWISWGNVIRW